jgi:hypothetical protein
VVLGTSGNLSRVYLNGGAGNFAAPMVLPSSGGDTSGVVVGDLNGDGALDLVLANWSQPSQIYLNDGAGQFAAPINIPNSGNGTSSLAAGDLNGDGALDLILTNYNEPSQIYLNDGAGTLMVPTLLPGSGNNPSSIAIGDLNGDGALDLVIGNNAAFQTSLVSLNDGTGDFNAPTILKQSNSRVFGAAIGDLNGDGRADVILADHNVGGQVYLNHLVGARLPNNPPSIAVARPGPTPAANFYSTPAILSDQHITIPYTLVMALQRLLVRTSKPERYSEKASSRSS